MDFDLDSVISHINTGNHLSEPVLLVIIKHLFEVLVAEENLLLLDSPISVCGDVHGQLWDVIHLFEVGGHPSVTKYLFLGDYVDRGFFSVETFLLIACYKLKYPKNIFMLRGNHESSDVNSGYGLYSEILTVYGHAGIWERMNALFEVLPIAALIDNKLFCVHGGISPHISLVDQISMINRKRQIEPKGPFSDLFWSDPDDNGSTWKENTRGAGFLFGSSAVKEFCQNNDLRMIIRSHQLAKEGYEYKFEKQLITIWSAPNYMYRSGNKAAILSFDTTLNPYIRVFEYIQSRNKSPNEEVSSYFM